MSRSEEQLRWSRRSSVGPGMLEIELPGKIGIGRLQIILVNIVRQST